MGLISQEEFAGGIFRSPRAPAGSVYDCIDGLIDDEAAIYKRGGVVNRSSADFAAAIQGLMDGDLPAGPRTLGWNAAGARVVNADDTISAGFPLPATLAPLARAAGHRGMVAIPTTTPGYVLLWGGATKANYSAGTISCTVGTTRVTGVGTAFLANVEPGMLMSDVGTGRSIDGVVATVIDDTHLDLLEGLYTTKAAVTALWTASVLKPDLQTYVASGTFPAAATYVAGVGGRLVVAVGNRAFHSSQSGQVFFEQTDYHELPPPARILGADAISDVLVLFATSGMWVVRNMYLDLTDAAGDIQQPQELLWKDLILWGDAGIAGMSSYAGILGWTGQLIVPCMDDVFMVGVDSAPVAISQGIRPKYREYVAAGYRPGTAQLFRGHYWLPIVDDTYTLIDTLVCRLDRRTSRGQVRPAWTRMTGKGRAVAYAGRVRPPAAPRLLGANGLRVTDLTDVFTPSAANKQDVGGTTFNLDVTTNDLEPGQMATLERARLVYELADAASDNPTIAASYSTGQEGAAFTALSGTAAENDGSTPKTWRITKRARRFRLRFLSSGPSSRLRIRALRWFVRDSDRP